MKQLFLLFILYGFGLYSFAQNPIQIIQGETLHGPDKGSLVIIGGGNVISEIWDEIIRLGGGTDKARFVVITNASGDKDDFHSAAIDTLTSRLGRDKITRLHLKSISEANDPKQLDVIRQATGLYFSGGRQWRIADVYLNTLAHQEFFNLLERGGVIAGSSAGASIQGSFLWRGDTSGPQILIGDHMQGLGFLKKSVIDQHLLVRNRQFDLVEFIKQAPQFIGLGLDESTAVVIQKDNLEVTGKSVVAIYDRSSPFLFLNKGQHYDLKERRIKKNK